MRFRKSLIALLVVVVLAAVGWSIFLRPASPTSIAEAALVSDAEVLVTNDRWLAFEPARRQADVGLVFYPGGLVPAEAYAPLARALAEEGFFVVVPHMPLHLAVLSPSKASEVLFAYEEIEHWVVGGHSLGGAMAARYVAESRNVEGLVMVAAYPSDRLDLTNRDIEVLVMYGSEDGLFSTDEVLESADQYPENAEFLQIDGGNHAQFGSYGRQRGDLPATITSLDQQSQTTDAIADFLRDIDDG